MTGDTMVQQLPIQEQPTLVRNRVGLISLILTAVGVVVVFGILGAPALLFLAIPLLLVAFILSIIGLTRKNARKGASVAALILSVVLGILGPIFFAGRFVADVGTAMAGSSTSVVSEEDAADVAGIGETVTNSDGVAFTVGGVDCGHAESTSAFGSSTVAKGEFCFVSVRIDNGSTEMVTLSTSDITGVIGESSYEADGMASDLGGDMVLTNINPGLGVDAVFGIDVPVGAVLEYVQLRPTWSFQDEVLVKVS